MCASFLKHADRSSLVRQYFFMGFRAAADWVWLPLKSFGGLRFRIVLALDLKHELEPAYNANDQNSHNVAPEFNMLAPASRFQLGFAKASPLPFAECQHVRQSLRWQESFLDIGLRV